jgi:hypothetical protein
VESLGHYRRPGHHHFGDGDPATDLTRPGCEAIGLAEVPLVRVLLPVDVDRLNAAGAATGDKWDGSAKPVGAEAPFLNLADRHSDWRYGGASPGRPSNTVGTTPVTLPSSSVRAKAADAVSKISLARSQEAQ